jgi:hypothetical protein
MRATPADYQNFIASLTPAEREQAIAAGLDQPPFDGPERSGNFQIRDDDGLPMFRKNLGRHPLVHEATRAPDAEDEPDTEIPAALAEALRRITLWLLGSFEPQQLHANGRTAASRLFILARALRLNGYDRPSLAEIAEGAGLTRASLSSIGVDLRDTFGNQHLLISSHSEQTRRAASIATTARWASGRMHRGGKKMGES